MRFEDLSDEQKMDYADLDDDAKAHPMVIDASGVLRFSTNPAILFLSAGRLNSLWDAAESGRWPVEYMRSLYRQMGYSLFGYLEVFPPELDRSHKGTEVPIEEC